MIEKPYRFSTKILLRLCRQIKNVFLFDTQKPKTKTLDIEKTTLLVILHAWSSTSFGKLQYRAMTYFDPPIISSISIEFALSEKHVEFWCTNLQLTAERSHYLMWLKIFMQLDQSASEVDQSA